MESTSTIEANEEVRTMRLILSFFADAARIDLTPLIAGRISSCSLLVVS